MNLQEGEGAVAEKRYVIPYRLHLEGDEAFNTWARQLAESRQNEGHPLIVVKIKKLKPLQSRIRQLELEQASLTAV